MRMKRYLVSLLVGLLALVPPGAPAADGQQLTITIHGDGARATQLPQYDPGSPIAITVSSTGGNVDAVIVSAAGPQGESIESNLTRAADGTFSGSVTLADEGSWQLRLTSRAGKASTVTTPILLDLEAPPPSNAWQIGLAVGLAIFIVIGVGGFFVLRRLVGTAPSTPGAHAA